MSVSVGGQLYERLRSMIIGGACVRVDPARVLAKSRKDEVAAMIEVRRSAPPGWQHYVLTAAAR